MEYREKTFTIFYRWFEPGEKVRHIATGEVYEVEQSTEPLYAGDRPVVILKGRRYGIEADELVSLESEEK